jgi:hypothetical protein
LTQFACSCFSAAAIIAGSAVDHDMSARAQARGDSHPIPLVEPVTNAVLP